MSQGNDDSHRIASPSGTTAAPRSGGRAWLVAWRILLGCFFVLGVALLAARYLLMPQVAAHRADLERLLSRELGLTVQIAELHGEWHGLRPELSMRELRIIDAGGRTALELPQVDVEVAWASLWHLAPRLARLEILRPELDIRREADGRIFVAGIPLDGHRSSASGGEDFVLQQESIVIRDGRVSWTDLQRAAPPLRLEKVGLRIENSGTRHRFALRASPSSEYSSSLDLRGDLRGASLKALDDWKGELYLSLDDADLAVWQKWADYPLQLPRGRGGLRAWLSFAGQDITRLDADVALAGVSLRLGKDVPQLDLASLRGQLGFSMRQGNIEAHAEKLTLATADGIHIGPTRFNLNYQPATARRGARGEFSTEAQDVALLAHLAAFLPLSEGARKELSVLAPEGRIDSLALNWEGSAPGVQPASAFAHFSVKAELKDITLHPVAALPGVKALSGEFSGNERAGRFSFGIEQGGLYLPAEMHEPFLALDKAALSGGWSHESPAGQSAQALTIRLDESTLANPRIKARVAGFWQARAAGPGYLEVQAGSDGVDLAQAWRFLPLAAPDTVVSWMRGALRAGRGEDLRFELKGDLADFPFDKRPGVFKLETRLRDATISEFAHGWPGLEAIQGSLLIDRKRLLIRADTGRYGKAVAQGVSVEVPDMMAADHEQVLTVAGKASGPNPDFLRYVNESAIHDMAASFLREVRMPQGDGNLDLKIAIPLGHAHNDTKVSGSYVFRAPALSLTSALPEFSAVNARLGFTEHGISLPSATAQFLGKRLSVSGVTEADGSLRFDAQTTLGAAGLRQLVDNPAFAYLTGEAPVAVTIRTHSGALDILAESTLVGMASGLPPPFTKSAAERWPLRFSLHQEHGEAVSLETWRLALLPRLDVLWRDECASGAPCRTRAGAVAIGEAATLPEAGWRVSGTLDEVDVARWQPAATAFLEGFNKPASTARVAPSATQSAPAGAASSVARVVEATPAPTPDIALALKVGRLDLGGYRFHNIAGTAQHRADEWRAQLAGPDLAGSLSWSGTGDGKLRARLSRLALANEPHKETPEQAASSSASSTGRLPELDIMADSFELRGKDFGQLSLLARNQGPLWRVEKLALKAHDLDLNGSGSWQQSGAEAGTHFDFRLRSADTGALLGRFGYPDTVRRGETDFSGTVSWRGAPTALDFSSLSGTLHLESGNGQFQSMEPGVGRLLGVLSLQSLPRRITLDFRDVFSAGFAFDRIAGNMKIAAGVLRTDDLEVRGPAARVFITGSTDLGREVHDLAIKVQPTLSETVAVGVVVGQAAVGVLNPVIGAVGAAAYLAQKLLRDPVEKIFSYEYRMTGSWSDPKVEKVGGLINLPGVSAEPAPGSPPEPVQVPLRPPLAPATSSPEENP